MVRVSDVGRVQLGRQRAPQYQTGRFTRPYVRVANIFENRIDLSDLLSMDFDAADFNAYRLEHGDILLNEGQSTELVGRPAMWRSELADCCFQNTLVRFQADHTKVLPEYALAVFLYYFRTGEFSKISSKTSNVAHLGAGRFAAMSFPLAPLPAQRRIAAILDQAEAVRSMRQRTLALLATTSASLFLARFGDPVTNAMGWPSAPLTEACQGNSGGTPSKANPAFWEGTLPWFSPKDLKRDDLFDAQDHISEELIKVTNLKLLPANTVVIVVRGMILAHTFPVCVLPASMREMT